MKTIKVSRFILPALLLCTACSKNEIKEPAAQRPATEIRGVMGYPDPDGKPTAAPLNQQGDGGAWIDPNGKPAAKPVQDDHGPVIDPNGKAVAAPANNSNFSSAIEPFGKYAPAATSADEGTGIDPHGRP